MDDLRLAVITGVIAVHIIGTYGVDVGWYEHGPNLPYPAIMVLPGPVWAALLFGLAPLFVLAGGRLPTRSPPTGLPRSSGADSSG